MAEIDPNVQTGVDAFGNPTNGYGMPLGQQPKQPTNGGDYGVPDVEGGFIAGMGDALRGLGTGFWGENEYNPMEGAPVISAPTIQAAQMQNAGMDTRQADEDRLWALGAREQQQRLGGAIMDRAMGRGGPSVAELQMQRGVGLAQQAAARQAASARGIGRGLAAYGAQNAQANLAAQGVQDAAALRAQETIAAQGLAGKLFTDQRMQDLTSRGMSIQQAQAIMDAENRAREANMNATNRARETNAANTLGASEANLQAETTRRGQLTQISEGNAERNQDASGGIVKSIGSIFGSDVRMKQDVQPLLYSSPLEVGGSVGGDGLSFSDKRAKTDAFVAGVKAASGTPALGKAAVSSAPVFELSPERTKRMGHETLRNAYAHQEQRQKLADAFAYLSDAQRAAPQIESRVTVPPPVPVAAVQPTATSDKRAKSYGYSDERAKDLEGENEMLKAALTRMGNKQSAKIRGDDPGLGAAVAQVGRDADVSNIPTAVYPDVSAGASREANPPPPYQYRYKDEFAAKQGTDTEPRLGFMAQDALKSPVYRPAVVKMPDGMLGIDQNRLIHANTAMLSGVHERQNELEQQNAALGEALMRMGDQKAREIRGL